MVHSKEARVAAPAWAIRRAFLRPAARRRRGGPGSSADGGLVAGLEAITLTPASRLPRGPWQLVADRDPHQGEEAEAGGEVTGLVPRAHLRGKLEGCPPEQVVAIDRQQRGLNRYRRTAFTRTAGRPALRVVRRAWPSGKCRVSWRWARVMSGPVMTSTSVCYRTLPTGIHRAMSAHLPVIRGRCANRAFIERMCEDRARLQLRTEGGPDGRQDRAQYSGSRGAVR